MIDRTEVTETSRVEDTIRAPRELSAEELRYSNKNSDGHRNK